ncbi:MAG: RNA polymerase sigma factor [Planctomycetota bacterium]|jgi:RNA polymerase sigma-70 factor (ECF subfamily)
MIKVSEGDRDAYTILYNKYFTAVVSFIASFNGQLHFSEDVAQEAFKRIWNKRKEYRPTAAFKTYLFDYAGKVFSEERKRLSKEAVLQERLIRQHSDSKSALFRQLPQAHFDEMTQTIVQGISALTFKQRQAVELYCFRGMSIKQASVQANCTVEAFEGRLRLARRQLDRLLTNQS